MKHGIEINATILKLILAFTILIASNYISNGYLNDYQFNILSFSSFYILYTFIYTYIEKRFSCKRTLLDLVILYLPLCITVMTALANSWALFFPEFVFIFLLGGMVIYCTYYYPKRYGYLLLLVIVSYLSGMYIINPYMFNKLKSASSAKEKIIMQELLLYDLDDNLVRIKLQTKKLSLLIFGAIDCLPCRQLDKDILEEIIEPYENKEGLSILKINQLDDSERIKAFYNPKVLKHLYKDKNHFLSKKFKIEGFPVILLLNSKGEILKRFDGYKPDFRTKFMKEIIEIIEQECQTNTQ